jgi:hypothetical protein
VRFQFSPKQAVVSILQFFVAGVLAVTVNPWFGVFVAMIRLEVR